MENSKSPIEMMGEYLAAMTLRAVEAERKLEATLEKEDMWYKKSMSLQEQLNEAKANIAVLSAKYNRLKSGVENTVAHFGTGVQQDAE